MHAESCDYGMTMDGNYFDITHSFKVGSSTYHVLGLRKTSPTYGNNYYIFNCTCNQSQSTKYASVSLPFVHSSRNCEHRSYTSTSARPGTADNISPRKGHERNAMSDRTRVRATSQKMITSDITEMKKTLTELMKSEHKTLVTSLRKDMIVEEKTLIRTIEKETEAVREATTTVKNDKQEIIRSIERQKSSLENTYERHASTITSSIDLLKKTITETLNAQQEQLQSIKQFQLTLSETVERQVEKTLVKYLETHKSTSLDVNTIKQFQSTFVEALEQHSSTTKDHHTDDTLIRHLDDQKQYFTDLVTKQQRTYALGISEIKQLQTTVIETLKQLSPTKNDNENDPLKRLFAEQRQHLTELISQQQSFSLDLIRETVINAFQEERSSAITIPSSTGMSHDRRPFKISIKTGEFAHVYAELNVDGLKCPKELHTLCQRDPLQVDVVDCFISPPTRDGPCDVTIYAKTKNETEYRAALSVQLSYLNVTAPITFPQLYPSFKEHQCILIEPLRRFLQHNEEVMLQMIIPGARDIKIRNGNDDLVLDDNEYRNGRIKKKLHIQGNVIVYGRWNGQNDSIICAFEME